MRMTSTTTTMTMKIAKITFWSELYFIITSVDVVVVVLRAKFIPSLYAMNALMRRRVCDVRVSLQITNMWFSLFRSINSPILCTHKLYFISTIFLRRFWFHFQMNKILKVKVSFPSSTQKTNEPSIVYHICFCCWIFAINKDILQIFPTRKFSMEMQCGLRWPNNWPIATKETFLRLQCTCSWPKIKSWVRRIVRFIEQKYFTLYDRSGILYRQTPHGMRQCNRKYKVKKMKLHATGHIGIFIL